jgi:Spy/CpxP family protein refolding chaperone
MKKSIYLFTVVACVGALSVASTSYAQKATAYAQQPSAMAKAEAISKELDLTPQQKLKALPILRDEAPKVKAIKDDNQLSKIQKVQQIRAIHQQTDPQMKAILSPEQYQKLKTIRQQAIRDATQSRHP